MELSEYQAYLIEGYLDGTLSPSEKEKFQIEKETSAAFREDLKLRLELIASLKAKARADLKADLKAELQNILETQSADATVVEVDPEPNTKRIWLWIGIAATVLLVIGLSIFMAQGDKKAEFEALFAENFQAFPAQPHQRTDSNPSESEAIFQYREGNYAAAIPLLKQSNFPDSLRYKLNLYIGCAYLAIDSTKKAHDYFARVLASSNPQANLHAEWYEALVSLKLGDEKAARLKLEAIVKAGSPYANQASRVLAQMKE